LQSLASPFLSLLSRQTADPLSMAALALPLIVFYFGAGGIALLVDKKRDRKSKQIGDNQAADIDQASPIDEPLPE